MKKVIVAISLAAVSLAALAKGGNESTPGGVIQYANLPRVLTFNEIRNTADARGATANPPAF